MAKKEEPKKANNDSLISLAQEIMPNIVTEMDKANTEALKSNSMRDNSKKRNAENHLQREYDHNVNESFEKSLKNCLDADGEIDEFKLKHLRSVLLAGPGKYDR